MARKKKQETNVEESENASFYGTLFSTGETECPPTYSQAPEESTVGTTINMTDEDFSKYAIKISDEEQRVRDIHLQKQIALAEIARCNAYIFSGRDLGLGRVFELSRKEWCDYYIDLEYFDTHPDDQSPLPKAPERQEYI